MTGELVVERTALPEAGGMWDQDAKTMRALEHLEAVVIAMWRERRGRDRASKRVRGRG